MQIVNWKMCAKQRILMQCNRHFCISCVNRTKIGMEKVFFLRHAQSEFNAGNREKLDAPLTELGRQQAATLSGHFNKVLCSPLTRAVQTLELSQVHNSLRCLIELHCHVSVWHRTRSTVLNAQRSLKFTIRRQRIALAICGVT